MLYGDVQASERGLGAVRTQVPGSSLVPLPCGAQPSVFFRITEQTPLLIIYVQIQSGQIWVLKLCANKTGKGNKHESNAVIRSRKKIRCLWIRVAIVPQKMRLGFKLVILPLHRFVFPSGFRVLKY